jgi:mono/diheme cytochrome c family protein
MKTVMALAVNFISAALILALITAILLLWRGVEAKSPGAWEARIIGAAKHSVFVKGKGLKNPLPKTSATAEDGRENFSHFCFGCHGLDGQNTGVPFSDSMSPPVPSLASKSVQSYDDGQLYWVIRNGLWPSGMPAAKGILTDDEIWSIVAYIRNLPPPGSLGEPVGYSGGGCAPTANAPRRRPKSH